MPVHEFRCPNCATRLRCRDRSWVGRRIQCPDCKGKVLVAAAPDGTLHGAPAESTPRDDSSADAAKTVDEGPPADGADAALPVQRRQTLGERVRSPAGIGWMVAGGIGLLLVGAFLGGPGEDDSSTNGGHQELSLIHI